MKFPGEMKTLAIFKDSFSYRQIIFGNIETTTKISPLLS